MNGKISWLRLAVYFIIAIVVSNLFRFDVFNLKETLKDLPGWLFIFIMVLLEGSGVFIGALLALSLFKRHCKTQISFFGTSKRYGLVMITIPIILLAVFGVKNDYKMNDHIYGLVAILGTLVYCIMEEYGWRGYLQEELRPLKKWPKYMAIGFLWYLWHLSFLKETSITDNLFFFGMMIFGSWGIGQVAEATKSILASACFHLIIQIMMLNSLIKNGIDGTEKIIILVVSIGIWFAIIKKWEKEHPPKPVEELKEG
ncbi:MAG: CPBP family intramembrane metalloprotease [Bacteroidia bacterium]